MALCDNDLENALTCEMYGSANVEIDLLSKPDLLVLQKSNKYLKAGKGWSAKVK